MAFNVQVVLDANEPHDVADWWAETLGWTVETTDEAFIRRMVAEGHAQESDTMTHRGALVWAVGAALSHPDGRRILVNRVPEPKTVKNRMHLDVRVGAADRAGEVQKLVDRGAVRLYEQSQGPYRWVTLQDPWGNEFCVT